MTNFQMWNNEDDSQESQGANQYPFWRLNFPHSPSRAIVDGITGFDHRMLPDSDLNKASDVVFGYVAKDLPWFLQDYLYRLGRDR